MSIPTRSTSSAESECYTRDGACLPVESTPDQEVLATRFRHKVRRLLQEEEALRVIRRSRDRHCLGPILTIDRIVLTAEEKRALAAESGAMAVDMESAAIASAASAYSVPFLAIRGVLDPVHEGLAIAFDQFLDSRGEPKPLSLIRYLLSHPFTLPHLVRLGHRTNAVCRRLGLLLHELIVHLA